MRKLSYHIGVTLDGFIAGPGGEIDFFPVTEDVLDAIRGQAPETLPTHVRGHLGFDDAPNQRYDTVVMGRGTYQPGLDAGFTSPYRHLRQYVVSGTLGRTTDPEVHLVDGDPVEFVRRLKKGDGLDIWLAGGGTLAGSLLPEIDELLVKRYPVAIGAGIPMFAAEFSPSHFGLVDSVTLASGMVVQTYTRA